MMSFSGGEFGPIARLALVIVFCLVGSAWGQKPQPAPAKAKTDLVEIDKTLMNEPPFDMIYMKAEAGGEEVRVLPIDFPNRVVPASPDPNGKFVVSLVQHPDRKYEVRWKDIAVRENGSPKVLLFEEMVMADAKKLFDQGEYAPAFEHMLFLSRFYPQFNGLDALKEDFLFKSAAKLFKDERFPHTLAVLEELQRTFPNSRNQVRTALSNVADKMVKKYVDDGDLRAAKMLLDRLKKDYADRPLEVVEQWDAEFRRRAIEYQNRARELMASGRFREAREAASSMLAIEPTVPGGNELMLEITRAHAMIRVGVFQTNKSPDPTSLTDWASRRSGQLVSRPLFQFKSTGPEGGVYSFALGTGGGFTQSDDRRELEMNFNKNTSPYSPDVAEWLMRRADPTSNDYRASWASILKEIKMESPERLIVRLKQPHVLPHALLQWRMEDLPSLANSTSAGAYRLGDQSELERSFVWAMKDKAEAGRPVEIVEKVYTEPKRAVADLLRGEIEIIDQLFPSDAKQLRGVKGVKVEPYALPTVHMLVPRGNHRYLRESAFRRALMYGINRESILKEEILGGVEVPGCQVLSGPFPMGYSDNDPLSYAYDAKVEPMPYDKTLSKLLFILTEKDIASAAAKKKVEAPAFEKIRLGVPNVEFAKAAGEAFVQQWALIGIPAEVIVLPPGATDAEDGEVDLLYVTAAIWEPVTDAERLFGADGIAATNDPFIVQALGMLRESRNWSEVRRSFQTLHRLIDNHLPVLPLWQVTDMMAYRTSLRGIPQRPMSLYQNLEKWRLGEEQR